MSNLKRKLTSSPYKEENTLWSEDIASKEEDPYWFTTYPSRNKFHPFHPCVDEICIEDIAHSLALICRYGGHIAEHYSVAQHSYLVSLLVPEKFSLEALLHDAEEAYIGDMVRPFKKHPSMGFFSVVADKIQWIIGEKFNLFQHVTLEEASIGRKLIHEADNICLLTEKKHLHSDIKNQEWIAGIQASNPNVKPSDKFEISYWHPMYAKEIFLKRFNYLWEKRQKNEQT